MKKLIVGIVLVVVILTLGVSFLIIPPQLLVNNVLTASVNVDGAFRNISKEKNWEKWFPQKIIGDSSGIYNLKSGDYYFKVHQILYNAVEVLIKKGNTTDTSLIQFIAQGKDSVRIGWSTIINTGSNPFSKINNYFRAAAIKKQTSQLLSSMRHYFEQSKNLYDLDIKMEKVAIEFMVINSKTFSHQPTTPEIYGIINEAYQYISLQKGELEGAPMLNILVKDTATYKVQIGIPIKQKIAENEFFKVKAMFKGGNILVANITGPQQKIDDGIKNFNQYMLDYQRTMMAMPFQMLITDRNKQKDSTKWITQLYFPVN